MQFAADFFHIVWPPVAAIVAATIGWFATEFLARPVRNFFDLRKEAKQLTLLLCQAPEYGSYPPEEWSTRMEPFKDNLDRLTDLSAKIIAFSQSERFAAWCVRILRYDPAEAGRAAQKIAFELGTNIEDRD
jgi:hypothetical protein